MSNESVAALTLTERAAEEVKRIMQEQKLDPEQAFLRFGIQGGGCSGFEYILGFVDAADDKDAHFESRGVRIVTDSKSLQFTMGTKIDFHADIMQRNFVFDNPLASRTCGCGTSFSV